MAEKANGNTRLSGRPVSSRRSPRVVEKLQQKIRDKEYYEAHQTYRVLYQRYKAQGKEDEALDLLYDGALLLLQHGQVSSGSDLGMLMMTHLKEKMIPVTDEWLEKIGKLFGQYSTSLLTTNSRSSSDPNTPSSSSPADNVMDTDDPGPCGVFEVIPNVDSREGLIRAALKWSNMVADDGQWKYGHPKLHKIAATVYWREKQYAKAKEHFIYSEEPQEYGTMLVELATTCGYSGEADLFIAQAVLQLLVLKDRKGGLGVFNSYTRKHPQFKTDNPPYLNHPTLNFIWFLLCACKDRSREVFQCLRGNYVATINRDPSFNEYLDKIGEAYFTPQGPSQSRSMTSASSAAPDPSGMFGLGGAGGLIEGILNSISSVLPQAAAGMASGAASMAAGSTSNGSSMQGSSQATFTMPTSGQHTTHHVHIGTMPNPIPRPGEPLREPRLPPEPTFTIAGAPFINPANLNLPPNIRFGTPQVNIHFGPPRTRNPNDPPPPRNPNVHVHRMGPTQHANIRINPPRAGGNIRFGPPPRAANIQFVTPQQGGGNIQFGPPQPGGNPSRPGHISVVGIQMEGVPIRVPGGMMMGTMGNSGPIITPEQQQLYQEHTQQQQSTTGRDGGTQHDNNTMATETPQQQPPPRSNEDMELD